MEKGHKADAFEGDPFASGGGLPLPGKAEAGD